MRILKFLIVALLVAGAVAFAIGWRLPQSHVATREREFALRPERVFREIATPVEYARWRTGVQRVEMLPDSGHMKRFKEYAMGDEITYVVEENVPGRRFVTTIAEAGLPYGGSWIFELTPTAKGTMVRITEEGEVYNPFFRFVSRYIMGHTRGIERYLSDLNERLEAAPQS